MAKRSSNGDPAALESARVQRLYEVSGHYGPWTWAEFQAAGIDQPTNAGSGEDRDRLPQEVREAVEAREAAQEQYDAAHQAWLDAAKATQAFYDKQRAPGPKTVFQPDDPRGRAEGAKRRAELDKLNDAESAAKVYRDEWAERVARAKAAEKKARKAVEARRIADSPRKVVD